MVRGRAAVRSERDGSSVARTASSGGGTRSAATQVGVELDARCNGRNLLLAAVTGALDAAQETLNTGDRLIDEQLRSDGWDLDEVSDDDALDFALPPSRAPERTSVWSCLCPCCAPS